MSPIERLPSLDGLRAVSILIVAFSHILGLAGFELIPGGLGVTIFFFISGFIITRLLLNEYAKENKVSLLPFYTRRLFRLTPALLVYIGTSAATLLALGMQVPGEDILSTLFYYANYHAIFNGFSVLGAEGVFSPLAITWSLAIEEHFYFVFPILLVALRAKPRQLGTVLAAFVALTLVWRLFLVNHYGIANLVPNRIYMGTDTRLDSIAYGCLLSVLFKAAEDKTSYAHRLIPILSGKVALLVSVGLMLTSLAIRDEAFRETWRYSLQGLAMIPLFCALYWSNTAPRVVRAALENKGMVYIGKISYSLYLYHFLGVSVAQYFATSTSAAGQVVLACLVALAGTLMSYYLIETPTRRIGAKLADRISYRATAGQTIKTI